MATAAATAAAAAATTSSASMRTLRLRASWDTNPSPKIANPTARGPPRTPRPSSSLSTALLEAPSAATPPSPARREEFPALQLWNSNKSQTKREQLEDDVYMGYERWLPAAPKVNKPRSIYNAASLAYLGDCIYELYARRHFLFPPLSIDAYNERVMSIVRCEAQDALLKKLLSEDYVTEEERDVLRWGKNIGSNKTRTRKRAGMQVYSSASSLETLIGYLYLTNMKRLEDLMYRMGFSTGVSAERIVEKKTQT